MTNVADRIVTFLALSQTDRRLFIEALFVQPVMPLGLRLLGFRRCRAALRRMTPTAGARVAAVGVSPHHVRHAARLVGAAGRPFHVRGTCLTRSLTLWWLLRRRGIPVQLCIGVRKPAGGVEAHAWVEHGDDVLNDDAQVRARYAAFGPPGGDLALHGARIR